MLAAILYGENIGDPK